MLNKVLDFLRRYEMLKPGDSVVCAVSGGADSMALLWGMYLMREKLGITVSAAHFNHGLRGDESDRDEAFVTDFCRDFHIPCTCCKGTVIAGKKGLEAAARDARYAFLRTLPGKIATAHTADDNAETVLMHMVRGTGLKGLGGISPISGVLIRPMLSVTRQDVLAFLEENGIPYVEDSTNGEDAFLRNRLRHRVMPALREENPRFSENMSRMALALREDEKLLSQVAGNANGLSVCRLREMDNAMCRRVLSAFLQMCGVREPERAHVELARALVFSDNPSAKADFPGGIRICRRYDVLTVAAQPEPLQTVPVAVPGVTDCAERKLRITCTDTDQRYFRFDRFTVRPVGKLVLRSRCPGDRIRLHGGEKSLKKLFIDRKIPAEERGQIPVLADDMGVIAVFGIGANLDRICDSGICVEFKTL